MKQLGGKKVYIAMSGGVDSSVAAALLKDEGYDVEGVTMCFHIPAMNGRKPSCCGVDGIKDARKIAKLLDIPHHVLDFAGEIDDFIIKDFVQEYLNGRTPNPCVRCNQYLKFGSLFRLVMDLGADYLATGHYANVFYNSKRHCYELKKAYDQKKDQSYFLYGIQRDFLNRILFPLGNRTKEEVRSIAQQYHFPIANKAESQDICFVPEKGYKQFLRNRLEKDCFVPGLFKNYLGEVVGEHQGIANYTIGQRDKLGLAFGYPVYVYKIEKETNTVYVGPEEYLYAQGLYGQQVNFISQNGPKEGMEVTARIRYHAKEIKGYLTPLAKDRLRIDFNEPQKAVTPGQSVVFYQGDIVLGGAIIEQPIKLPSNKVV